MSDTIIMNFAPEARRHHLRMLEALLFAAPHPLSLDTLKARMPEDADVEGALQELRSAYANRGVTLYEVAEGYAFRTAPDLADLLRDFAVEEKKLSKAALETLAIIAYHQPVTRAEIEAVRGVRMGAGTLDILLETGWIKLRGRRKTPGRPVTYGTTRAFLEHFSLPNLRDLPGLDDLRGAGFLTGRFPAGFSVPQPSDDDDTLAPDEDPLEDDEPDA